LEVHIRSPGPKREVWKAGLPDSRRQVGTTFSTKTLGAVGSDEKNGKLEGLWFTVRFLQKF